jgi:hypothetical protein
MLLWHLNHSLIDIFISCLEDIVHLGSWVEKLSLAKPFFRTSMGVIMKEVGWFRAIVAILGNETTLI